MTRNPAHAASPKAAATNLAAATALPALRLEGLHKRYGARRVLGPVDFTVGAHETVALLGANGSGKTTLLRIAATLAPPTQGGLHVAGHDAVRDPDAARRHIGTQLQDAPSFPDLTPREHLIWWSRMTPSHPTGAHDARSGAAARPVDDLEGELVAAGLGAAADRVRLSRGERQRLALLLALRADPPLALLDEPFTALDAAGRAWLEGLLQARRGRRATLLALHDEADARRLADRVVRLDAGRLVPA